MHLVIKQLKFDNTLEREIGNYKQTEQAIMEQGGGYLPAIMFHFSSIYES